MLALPLVIGRQRHGIACYRERKHLNAVLSYFFFDEDFLRGTLAPAFRACESPIAIACFLLVTFLPDRPLFKVPFFRSCIAFSTFLDAFFPYLAIADVPPSESA
jgi:hypothetical protein